MADLVRAPEFDPARVPQHIAIIMDGNGRWATARGFDRLAGHQRGARTVVEIVDAAVALHARHGNPTHLTLYSFSVENWKRPVSEVEALMQLYIDFLAEQTPRMIRDNVRYHQIGRAQELPEPVYEQMLVSKSATEKNTGLNLTLALNYSSRTEITDAVTAIAKAVKSGELSLRDITEQTVSDHLYTAGFPDPDLLIRTAGELRLSNYLLWQISYAELYVSETLWPEYTPADLFTAIDAFGRRTRKFGAVIPSIQPAAGVGPGTSP